MKAAVISGSGDITVIANRDITQNVVGDTRHVRNAGYGEFGLVAVESDACDSRRFHLAVFLQGNKRPRAVLKAVQDPQGNIVFAGEFHGTDL